MTVTSVRAVPVDAEYIFIVSVMTRVILPQVASNCFYVVCYFHGEG